MLKEIGFQFSWPMPYFPRSYPFSTERLFRALSYKTSSFLGERKGGGGSIAMMKIDEQSRGREAIQILSFVTCHNSQ